MVNLTKKLNDIHLSIYKRTQRKQKQCTFLFGGCVGPCPSNKTGIPRNWLANRVYKRLQMKRFRITSMALTRYSERTEIHKVKIVSHIMDSHLEISGASSSSPSVWSPPWLYTIYQIKRFTIKQKRREWGFFSILLWWKIEMDYSTGEKDENRNYIN